ncbi:hypothetical protein JCM9279_004309 [Rhodotorula babjevae]
MVRAAALVHAGAPPDSADSPGQPRPHKRQRQSTSLPRASSFFVPHLPGLPPGARLPLFAGLLPSTPPTSTSDAQLYFLLARNKHIPKRERLVIWLNGGPGCSSFDGALIELGPVKVNKDAETLRMVESTAWNEYANVLFLDQPAGTGFSFVTKNDDVRELPAAAEQVVMFLANFYKVFPEFSNMDTFIAGESYAGQYIPYIADAIDKTMLLPTRLKGLLIGNGWISPREQYPAYLTYLERRGFLRKGTQAHRNVLAATEKCNATLAAMDARGAGGKGMVLVPDCEAILSVMGAATMKDGQCLNSYDTREYFACGTPWPHELTEVTKYLHRPDVIDALHATTVPHKWTHCSQPVASKFWTPNSAPSVALLPDLLAKMPVLLFAGDQDLMCAGIGIEAAIAQLEWNGDKGFGDAEVLDWTVGEEKAGRWTTARNLTYVEFTNSSHMVPLDKPLAAHDMLLRFMQVDTLHSAGSAARIPSRIGSEPATILGATHPNGSTLAGALDALSPGSSSSSSSSADLDADGDPASSSSGGDKDALAHDGFNIEHERTYGPRRTAALVVLLVLVGGLVWGVVHWRKARRRERYRRQKGKGRAIRLEERGGADGRGDEEDEDEEDVEEGGRGRGYRDGARRGERRGEDAETVAVFDVGEDEESDRDDDDEAERVDKAQRRRRDDPEAWGDLGRTPDPKQDLVWGGRTS